MQTGRRPCADQRAASEGTTRAHLDLRPRASGPARTWRPAASRGGGGAAQRHGPGRPRPPLPAASPAAARLKAATRPLLPAPAGDARASRSFRASAAAAPSPERDAASPDGSADRPPTPGSPAVSYPRETQRGNDMSRGDVDRQVPGTERPRFKAVAPPFRHLRPKDTGA